MIDTATHTDRGKRFKMIRRHTGETQTQFGQRFNVTPTTISRYESGRLPEERILIKLTDMGFSIDWLLTGEGEMERNGDLELSSFSGCILRDVDQDLSEEDTKKIKLVIATVKTLMEMDELK